MGLFPMPLRIGGVGGGGGGAYFFFAEIRRAFKMSRGGVGRGEEKKVCSLSLSLFPPAPGSPHLPRERGGGGILGEQKKEIEYLVVL